jgi:hypothetical protein
MSRTNGRTETSRKAPDGRKVPDGRNELRPYNPGPVGAQ